VEIYRRQESQLVLTATKLINEQITSPLLPEFSCFVKNIFQ
jgi:Uma2 family endonuclease